MRPLHLGLLAVVVSIALIVLAEVLLWVAGFESLRQRTMAQPGAPLAARPKAIVDDPDFGWVLSPGFDEEIEGIRYTVNSFGFRGDDIQREKPKGALRIRNSWGTGWGQEGYFTMPYAYLTDSGLAADFWTLRLVEG